MLVGAGGIAPTMDGNGHNGGNTSLDVTISSGNYSLYCGGGEKGLRGALESGNIHGRGGMGGFTYVSPDFPAMIITSFGGDGTNANGGAANVMTNSCGNGGASFFGGGGSGGVHSVDDTARINRGNHGRAFGSGGGGSKISHSGAGAQGIIIITYNL